MKEEIIKEKSTTLTISSGKFLADWSYVKSEPDNAMKLLRVRREGMGGWVSVRNVGM